MSRHSDSDTDSTTSEHEFETIKLTPTTEQITGPRLLSLSTKKGPVTRSRARTRAAKLIEKLFSPKQSEEDTEPGPTPKKLTESNLPGQSTSLFSRRDTELIPDTKSSPEKLTSSIPSNTTPEVQNYWRTPVRPTPTLIPRTLNSTPIRPINYNLPYYKKDPSTPFSDFINQQAPFLQKQILSEKFNIPVLKTPQALPHSYYIKKANQEKINPSSIPANQHEEMANPPPPRRYIQKPETYDGKTCSWEYIKSFRLICSSNGWDDSDEIKIQALTGALRGSALDWYVNYVQTKTADSPALTYEALEKMFLEAFRSPNLNKNTAEIKALGRKQAIDEKPELYLHSKRQLLLLWQPNMTIETQIFYIIRGLKPSLIEPVTLLDPKTMEALILAIRRVDDARILKENRMETNLIIDTLDRVEHLEKTLLTLATNTANKPITNVTSTSQQIEARKCYKCLDEGHLIAQCPLWTFQNANQKPKPRVRSANTRSNTKQFCDYHQVSSHSTENCSLNPRRAPPRQNERYCAIHNSGTHSTHECSLNKNKRTRNTGANLYCNFHRTLGHSDSQCMTQNPHLRPNYPNEEAPRQRQMRSGGGPSHQNTQRTTHFQNPQ